MRSRITITLTTLVMAISLSAAPAAAQSVNESLVVLPTFSVTVGTAAVNYGSITPGAYSGWQFIAGTVTSNAPIAMTFEARDFSGPMTLDDGIRYMCIAGFVDSPLIPAVDSCDFAPALEALVPAYSSTGPVADAQWQLESAVKIPTGALAGSYASQIELTFYNPS